MEKSLRFHYKKVFGKYNQTILNASTDLSTNIVRQNLFKMKSIIYWLGTKSTVIFLPRWKLLGCIIDLLKFIHFRMEMGVWLEH